MRVLFTMMEELPVQDENGEAYIQGSALPNGVPILMIHPSNLDSLVGVAKKYARTHDMLVELVCVDLQQIFASDFVSPSAVPGLPEWVSIN